MKFYCLIFLIILLASCVNKPKNSDYYQLRRQLTPDRRHYIYDYKREGPFVTSNEIFGRRLIRSDEPFSENGGEDVDGIIDHWSKDTLIIHTSIRDYEHTKDTFVIKTDYKSYDGIIIKKIYEQPIVGGGFEDQFDFDSITIADNRIKFYGAKSKFEDKKNPNRNINFPTGEVIIYSDSGFITKIDIDKQFKSMKFSRINESGKWLYNQPEVLINTYELTPRKKINTNTLGEIGIFKDFKLSTKH